MGTARTSKRLSTRRRGFLPQLAAALAVLAAAGAAFAQSADDEKRAKEQFEAGQEAVKKGDLQRARALFRSSYELGHSAGPILNLADCEERLGLLASARQHFRDAVPLLPKGDPRVAYAKQRATALDARVPLLRIDLVASLPAGARLLLDQDELPEAKRGTDLPLDAGSHTVTVIAPGHEDWSRTVKLVDSKRTVLVAEVGKPRSAPPVVSTSIVPGPVVPPPTSEGRGTWRTIGWTVGGVGLAGLAVGVGTGIAVLQRKGELEKRCPAPDQCDVTGVKMAADGTTLGIATTAVLAAGALCAAGGVVLVLLNRDTRPVTVTTLASPTGVALGVRGAF